MLAPREDRRKGSEIIGFAGWAAAALSCSLHFQSTSGTPPHASDASEMTGSNRKTKEGKPLLRAALAAMALSTAVLLAGCDSFTQVYQRGCVLPEGPLE